MANRGIYACIYGGKLMVTPTVKQQVDIVQSVSRRWTLDTGQADMCNFFFWRPVCSSEFAPTLCEAYEDCRTRVVKCQIFYMNNFHKHFFHEYICKFRDIFELWTKIVKCKIFYWQLKYCSCFVQIYSQHLATLLQNQNCKI